MPDLLIRGPLVLRSADAPPLERIDLRIQAGRIVEMGPGLRGRESDRVIYADAGIRAWVSVKLMDRPLLATLPVDRGRVPRSILRELGRVRLPDGRALMSWMRRIMRREDRLGGIARVIPNPSAPQRCTDALLRGIHRLAVERDFPFVIHVQETRLQAVQGPRTYGTSLIGHLERLCVLPERTSITHRG